jgi:glycosyltransferase involved in cell wall biosynthesis
VKRIAAIIPALDEALCIEECIGSLLRQPSIGQVIVADGGSRDGTTAIAETAGAKVVLCPHQGRGRQIAEGIGHCDAEVVLVVHADCRLDRGAAGRMLTALNDDPFLCGGAFGMYFIGEARLRFRLIAALNNLRAHLTGISFGDQGQFVRREALERIGGFPDQVLMEDVELSLRLRKAGRRVLLPRAMGVSPRRWEAQPLCGGVGRVLWLFGNYLWFRRRGVRVDDLARACYLRYYRSLPIQSENSSLTREYRGRCRNRDRIP